MSTRLVVDPSSHLSFFVRHFDPRMKVGERIELNLIELNWTRKFEFEFEIEFALNSICGSIEWLNKSKGKRAMEMEHRFTFSSGWFECCCWHSRWICNKKATNLSDALPIERANRSWAFDKVAMTMTMKPMPMSMPMSMSIPIIMMIWEEGR